MVPLVNDSTVPCRWPVVPRMYSDDTLWAAQQSPCTQRYLIGDQWYLIGGQRGWWGHQWCFVAGQYVPTVPCGCFNGTPRKIQSYLVVCQPYLALKCYGISFQSTTPPARAVIYILWSQRYLWSSSKSLSGTLWEMYGTSNDPGRPRRQPVEHHEWCVVFQTDQAIYMVLCRWF